jgi:hypothetical protein
VLELVLHGLLHEVEVGQLVEHAVHAAFGAGPIVFLEARDQAADFVVGIFAGLVNVC